MYANQNMQHHLKTKTNSLVQVTIKIGDPFHAGAHTRERHLAYDTPLLDSHSLLLHVVPTYPAPCSFPFLLVTPGCILIWFGACLDTPVRVGW